MQMSMENRVSAGFFVRFVAYIIDTMIAAMAVLIIKLPLSFASGSLPFLKANFIFNFTVIDVVSYLGMVAYFILLTYFSHSTLGKMLLRLEVVTKDGEWTFVNILYRETIGRFLSSLLNIGYLAVIVTKDNQGFHDMLCDTVVVYKKMQKPAALTVEKPVMQQQTMMQAKMPQQTMVQTTMPQQMVTEALQPAVTEPTVQKVQSPTYYQ